MNRTGPTKALPARLLTACCAVMLCFGVRAQQRLSNPSSELPVRVGGLTADTASINRLIDTANALIKTDPDSALALYRQVADRSDRIHYLRGRSIAYNNMSATYKEKLDFPAAVFYLRESMRIPYSSKKMFLVQFVDLSDLYYQTGNFQSIRMLYNRAVPFFDTRDPKELKIFARLNKYMAIMHLRTGNYDSAFTYYYRILTDLQAPDSTNFTTFVETYNGLGAASSRIGLNNRALYYFEAALALATRYRDTNQVTMSMGNKVGAYVGMKEYRKAKKVCLQTLALARSMKYYSYESINAAEMAIILNEEKAYEEALTYCREAFDCAKKIGHFDNQISAAYIMGYTLTRLGRYREAEQYVLPALELARKRGRMDNIGDAYSHLADIYSASGKYRDAYEYMSLYAHIQDSLRDRQVTERMAAMELKYKTAQTDKILAQQQLQLTQKESKLREKNLLLGGLALGLVLVATIAVGKYRHRQRLQSEQLRNLAQQQEIDRLNARMQGEEMERGRIAQELHDGVTVLLSAAKMNYTALGKEYEEITGAKTYHEVMQLLNETGQELRSISYNLVPELLLRQSLPAALQAFCSLIQKGHNLETEMQSYGSFAHLDVGLAHTIYRIVQELIHNIVRHAQASKVLVQLIRRDDTLYLTVEDNGIGFEADRSPAGMGLQNLQDRIRALNGHLVVASQPGVGTTIDIEIPLNHERGNEDQDLHRG